MALIEVRNISRIYTMGENKIQALDNISFEVEKGMFAVVLGPSGAGKTTLLNLIGGMDQATSGELIVDGKDVTKFNRKELTDYRRKNIGFVFQFYNLMPNLTALENVELSVEMCKGALEPEKVLSDCGLEGRMNNFPSQLSGGEQQRVSIARALAKNPTLLLCDEPTGALDYQTGKSILKLLFDMCQKEHKTVIVVTHNQALKYMANKVIYIKNGKVDHEIINDNPKPIEEIEW